MGLPLEGSCGKGRGAALRTTDYFELDPTAGAYPRFWRVDGRVRLGRS
jgi:hypothetical protein